jgi:hypothetical protein
MIVNLEDKLNKMAKFYILENWKRLQLEDLS